MVRSISIRRSLLQNLVAVILLLSGAIMATTVFGARHASRELSQALVNLAIEDTEVRLRRFFAPITQTLRVVQTWGDAGRLDFDRPAQMNSLLAPLMQQTPYISALIVADGHGREHMLLRTGAKWSSRQMWLDEWGTRVRWLEWSDSQPEPIEAWREETYDPRDRPWYRGAIQRRIDAAEASETFPDATVHWTTPYTFFTVQEPGLTAARAFDAHDGTLRVVGCDVLVRDISDFTAGLQIGERGKIAVLTEDDRVIGLPNDPAFATPEQRRRALLKRADELDLPLARDAVKAFSTRPFDPSEPRLFRSGGENWWGHAKTIRLGPRRSLWIGVLLPESELVADMDELRVWILGITAVVLLGAIWQAFVLARRYSEPVEALVRQSDRIGRGDLERGEPVTSRVKEVRRLAGALDGMRTALRSLLKLERDLQLARQIQQNTFPDHLPTLSGYELAAWSDPADETGGDTYDVIGYRRPAEGGPIVISQDNAERAVLLMADATGHGVGPALSVTQARAMLRMAIRADDDLRMIVRRMNEQLCADLPVNHFITAWLGALDAADHTLASLSAGQGPLLHFEAASNDVHVLSADTLPLGIDEAVQPPDAKRIVMGPGDIFAVISDGIFEAADRSGTPFGNDRVIELIRTQHAASATEIITALRAAVAEYAAGVPADDDRTALIIKRTRP